MMRRGRLQRTRIKPVEMNLAITPMIDVIFQLQIYFLLTAAFVLGEGVLLTNLAADTGAPEAAFDPLLQPIQITLAPDGRIDMPLASAPPANFSELAARLAELRAPQGPFPASTPIVIQPRGDVPWQYIVSALNAALRAQWKDVSLLDQSTEGMLP